MMRCSTSLWILSTVILSCHVFLTESSKTEPNILVFGGTRNIGAEVVHHLLKHNYKPTLVSRGGWRYDSLTLIKPHVTHFPCNRYIRPPESPKDNLLKKCPELLDYVERTPHFDFVIDFSAYSSGVIRHAAEILKGKIGLYIYISSTAVYEVCDATRNKRIIDTNCVRPGNKQERWRLVEGNSYANWKLQAEEYLQKQRRRGGFPYLIFRLADVIGPRDHSERWWQLQWLVKYHHVIERPIPIREDDSHSKFSLTFTKDVAKAIRSALEAGEAVHDQIYNLAFDKHLHYKNLISFIAKKLNVEGIEFEENRDAYRIYPSVTRGPVDISKTKSELGFEPEPWKHAVAYTVNWHEKAFYDHYSRLETVINSFVQIYVAEENRDAVLAAMHEGMPREEL